MSFTMSEHLIRYVIEEGIEFFRENPQYLDYVLTTHEEDTVKNLKTIITTLEIPVLVGFPRDNMSSPMIALFLEGEQEKVDNLGDIIGDHNTTDYAIFPVTVTSEIITSSSETFPFFYLANRPINAAHTLYKDGTVLDTADYTLNFYTTAGRWGATCTKTSTYTADYVWYQNYQEELCAGINSVYRIEIISNNIEEVLCLYRLVQYLLMADRWDLSDMGLKNQKMYGGDLEPLEQSDQPNLLYSRALYFEFTMDGGSVIPLDVLKSIQVSATITL